MLKLLIVLCSFSILFGCNEPIRRNPPLSKQETLVFHLEEARRYGQSAMNLVREADKQLLEYSLSNRSETMRLADKLYKQAEIMHEQEFNHTMAAQITYNQLKFKYPDDLQFKTIVNQDSTN